MELTTLSRYDLMALFGFSYRTSRRMVEVIVDSYADDWNLRKRRFPIEHLELHKGITVEEITKRLKDVYSKETYKRGMYNCNNCIVNEKPCVKHQTAFLLMNEKKQEQFSFGWNKRKFAG